MPSSEMLSFSQVLSLIDEIKKHKADHKISVARELPEYSVTDAVLKKFIANPAFAPYVEFVRQTMRVRVLK